MSEQSDDIRIGETVEYAGGRYTVADRCCDLLSLVGVACMDVYYANGAKVWGRSATARERVTVLASDVRRVEAEGE